MRVSAWRTAGLLLLLTLLALPTLPANAQGGRSFSRCVHSCNAQRLACADRCETSCLAMFPNDADQREACLALCQMDCTDVDAECKMLCKVLKDPIPSEP